MPELDDMTADAVRRGEPVQPKFEQVETHPGPDAIRTYIGTKIIQAKPMDELTFKHDVKGKVVPAVSETRAGYQVMYPDGYISWSPKIVFEQAYRLVTDAEAALIAG